jgi:hypothetical protein
MLYFVTPGDSHHEEAIQGRFGDRNFSGFLLFSHHRDEFYVRAGLGVGTVLTLREVGLHCL